MLEPYIQEQRHLNAKMRAILLDWIVDVHQTLGYRPETLYRTTFILDKVCGMGWRGYTAHL